jgi:hypothetical protein
MRLILRPITFSGLLLVAAACGSSTGPATVTLDAIAPAPGATAVATGTSVTLTFSAAMATGMEQFIDLHQDNLGGPVVPMACGWDVPRTVLTCTHAPFAAGTTYLIHMGGGLHAMSGGMMDFDAWTSAGGTRMTAGMMGSMHNGQPIGMMGSGWHHGSDYGMTCWFTTG